MLRVWYPDLQQQYHTWDQILRPHSSPTASQILEARSSNLHFREFSRWSNANSSLGTTAIEPYYSKCGPWTDSVSITWVVVVQSLSRVQLFVTPWTSLPIIIFQSLLKFMSIGLVMPSNHLILWVPPSSPALNFSQHQALLQWVSSSQQVVKVLELQL